MRRYFKIGYAESESIIVIRLQDCIITTRLCLIVVGECVSVCDDILNSGIPNVKALFRRGAAKCQMPERLRDGYIDLKRAHLLRFSF